LDADVQLPNVFGDHMVLQQNKPVRIFGTAESGEKVTVEILGRTNSTTADQQGKWRVEFPGQKADGKPFDVTISGKNRIVLKEVLLGEVWICSGQSNMEWSVASSLNAQEEIAAAHHPNIRLFNVPGHITSPIERDNTPGVWSPCSSKSVRNFSAVAYYFGRKLAEETDVPIGLIGTNWGGTRIEPWTPKRGFDTVPELNRISNHLEKLDPKTEAGKEYYRAYLEQVSQYIDKSKNAIDDGKAPGNPPMRDDFGPVARATTIYNAMVHGLTPLQVRGVIWYQGESNADDGLKYEFLKRALVNGWRKSFENEDLSFYWVQLANFRKPDDNPAGGGWGPVREGQRRALAMSNTGMAVIIDIGAANDIHPRNKQDVGKRLARWALRDHHDQDVVVSGPLYKSMKTDGKKVVLSFDHVGGGLMAGRKNGLEETSSVDEELKHFAIAGADRKWHWATAKIDGDKVVVWSEKVQAPVAVRYAYQSNPVGVNFYNKAGLPASPFKTDDW